ncbi:MAG TPA: DUF72 domain-containing protein [Ramlibacter sp.]|jgi:uncharacterized protein YecE (DUF72 family)|uniref:DUF72 domain-containing protein n=1 Tax=Ramlibacter sp. TaxID=1917967 RepID=UPI002D50FF24|nr:DUF72 domain-containing protein [Ramlibacter sp.]HZY18497.1 DUF72 domain-containing protein [Ramlibacter sp.]
MAGKVYIGVSGWRYEPWRGNFYPRGLAQARELHHASRQFNSIELNGSFYSLQRPASYAAWAEQTPPGFVFAVKGGRYITHMLKLRHAQAALGNFFASGLFALGPKLGPILWQFPPNLGFHPAVFEEFLSALPRTTAAAAKVALGRDHRLKGHELLEPQHRQRLRHAVEVRHPSFVDPAFIALLRRYQVAWVVADTPQPWPLYEDVTADFVYMRLHGATELYKSRYTGEQLDRWAACIDAWRRGGQPQDARLVSFEPPPAAGQRDVYCYFDNTDKLHAPDNARELMERLGLPLTPSAAGRWTP